MSNLLSSNGKASSSRTQIYLIGAAAGLLFGLLSAYIFNRAASDSGSLPDGRNRVQTGEVLGLALAMLGIVRQVAEMGRGPAPKKGRGK